MARDIKSTTTDTELLDTNIFNEIDGTGAIPVQPTLTTQSTKCAGIVKLVNRFIKLLYTIKGSNYLDKEEGTEFVQIFNLNIQDSDVAHSKVQDAIDDATEQIIATQSLQGVPNTERLRRTFISAFDIEDETRELSIEITLEVLTGDTTSVQLPSITLENV